MTLGQNEHKVPKLIKDRIIIVILDTVLDRIYNILVCQKCGKKAKIRDITKLPKTCSKCKRSPYTGPEKRGRPKK